MLYNTTQDTLQFYKRIILCWIWQTCLWEATKDFANHEDHAEAENNFHIYFSYHRIQTPEREFFSFKFVRDQGSFAIPISQVFHQVKSSFLFLNEVLAKSSVESIEG